MSDELVPEKDTPPEVKQRVAAGPPRVPVFEPTLGIDVPRADRGEPPHRLVAIGDSLTHGVQSAAVFNTDIAYPAIIARELGWFPHYRYPRYGGPGGLPFNIEFLLRELEREFGDSFSVWELPGALYRAWRWLDELEEYWERGPGSVPPRTTAINHCLAVYGWDLRDVLAKTAAWCAHQLSQPPEDDWLISKVDHDSARAAQYVYPTAPEHRNLNLLRAAAVLGDQHDDSTDHGIETLIVFLGANNALPTVTKLKVCWSGDGYDQLGTKDAYTIWRPSHFIAELALLAEQVRDIKARHVIWCTVPHVTVAPIARGYGKTKVRDRSRYFPAYTRPWISDEQFDPERDEHITERQARAVDYAIDMFNDAIQDTVEQARRAGRDWYLLDIAGLLDRLASRRFIEDTSARPEWWKEYEFPAALKALDPLPDSRFLTGDGKGGRATGGLFSLDGVHPTTIAYGLIAQEMIDIMSAAGVVFRHPTGTERRGRVQVDFDRLVERDTLIRRPPRNLGSGLKTLGWADDALDFAMRAFPGKRPVC